MKKIFTLISMAFMAMSVNAQDVYDAIVDGKLAPEFAAVAGENGGVANNIADSKSIVTMTAGKATVTAVGGTTPANADGGGQQITPGAVLDADKHIYEVASVEAWNDITWKVDAGKSSLGFSLVKGTGNPCVNMMAEEIWTDDAPTGKYRASYTLYEPDGSKGLPTTGLYYKFTATAAGAFKVKVWINKGGTNFTYVVNAKDAKAQKLFASGYINGVNDAKGQMRMLNVQQVDSVHHNWIWGSYEAEIAKGEESTKTAEELEAMRADCEAKEVQYKYVVGRNNQAFWGWLTFDVEAGEEYYVFQGQTQIGFAGFEFHEGKTAEELIGDIEEPYSYTTNFSTYEDETTGERVTWKGEKAHGNGQFASEEPELGENEKPLNIVPFGDFFRNDGSGKRASYCLLPEDVLAHSAKTEALTIAVWVRAQKETTSADYMWAPLFTAYAADNAGGNNTFPMMACQYRGVLQVNCAGWTDYVDAQNVAGTNTLYHGDLDWLKDHKWHHYAAVFEGENAKVFIDGVLKNEWDVTKVAENTQKGLFSNGADLKWICLGGNQAWDWNDNDAPFDFARLLIKNSKMTAGEIAAQMKADFGDNDMEAYYAEGGDTGVKAVKTVQNGNVARYNLAGQKVNDDFKGIVVKDGKKFVNK